MSDFEAVLAGLLALGLEAGPAGAAAPVHEQTLRAGDENEIVLEVSSPAFDVVVQVARSGSPPIEQDAPTRRWNREFVVIPPGTGDWHVAVHPKAATADPLTVEVRVLEAPPRDQVAIHELHQAIARGADPPAAPPGRSCDPLEVELARVITWQRVEAEDFAEARDRAGDLLHRCTDLAPVIRADLRWALAEATLGLEAYPEAEKRYAEALAAIDDLPPAAPVALMEAEVRGGLGLTCAQNRMLARKAEGLPACGEQLQRALALAREHGDYKLIAELLNLSAPYYWIARDPERARSALEESLRFHVLSGSPRGANAAWNNLGLSYRMAGELRASLQAFRMALGLPGTDLDKAYESVNLATAYTSLGDDQRAERYLRTAVDLFAEAGNSYARAVAEFRLAATLFRQQRLDEATRINQRALATFRETQPARVPAGLLALARLRLAAGDLDDARRLLDEARDGSAQAPPVRDHFETLLVAAELAVLEEETTELDATYEQLQALAGSPSLLPGQRLRFHELGLLGAHTPGELASRWTAAWAELEGIRAAVNTEPAGLDWTAESAHVVDAYLHRLWGLTEDPGGFAVQAWTALELVQARNLSERRLRLSEIPERKLEVAAAEGEVWESFLAAERFALFGSDETAREAALLERDRAQELLLANIEPVEATLRPGTIGLEDVQQALPDDQVLLRYHLGRRSQFVIVLASGSVAVERLPAEAVLERSVGAMAAAVGTGTLPLEALSALARFVPAAALPAAARRLIIVPDGLLHAVPFAAVNLSGDPGHFDPLVAEFELVRIYAPALYFESMPRAGDFATRIAIFADPAYDSRELAAAAHGQLRAWGDSLSRLPFTAVEARAIQALMPAGSAVVYTGRAATRERLLSEEFLEARVLHIASHGLFDPAFPELMGIATAPSGSQDGPGFLSLSELLRQDVASQLVVISGCETALGEVVSGEGMTGLTWGLLAQGAGAVMSTVWRIPDSATAEFMKRFYGALEQRGGDVVAALADAQRSMARDRRYRHPANWAGFVLTAARQEALRLNGLFDGAGEAEDPAATAPAGE